MVEIRSRQKHQYDAANRLVQVKNDSDVTIASLQGNRYPCGIMSGQQAALATPCFPKFNKVSGDRFMLRDQPLFQGALSASARNGLVGYVANRPTVVFRPTKVLPSACESVLALVVHLATAETYTSITKFRSSRFHRQLRFPIANQFRWHLLKLEMPFFRN